MARRSRHGFFGRPPRGGRRMTDENVRLREFLALHFHRDLGSVYWLDRQEKLRLNVRDRVRSIDDLSLLGPMPLDDLRKYPLRAFIPQAFHSHLHRFVVGETAGTGGEPRA